MIVCSISLSDGILDHRSECLIPFLTLNLFTSLLQAELHLRDRKGDEAVHLTGERKRSATDVSGGAGQEAGCKALALFSDS